MSRILVIGRTGQVARALAEVVPGATFLGREALDLAEPGAAGPAIAATAPEVVINAAAYTAVDRAEGEPDLARRVNAEAVGEIAEASARAGARLIHISTDYVYPGSGTRAHVESDPTEPVNTYGATKLAGEAAAREANPRTVILRTSWVYAPWGHNFVRTMLRLAERERLTIVADQFGQPTSALHIARACAAVAGNAGAPAGVYHVAGAGVTSWAGFAREIFRGALARGLISTAPEIVDIPTADYPTPARRPLNSRLDCTRFAETFGLAPRPWTEALAKTLDRLAEAR